MLCSEGHLTSTRLGRKLPRGWECWGLSAREEWTVYTERCSALQAAHPFHDGLRTTGAPVWRSATRSNVRKLQAIQSKCLRAATGSPWYISNRQIHEDLGVPFFADHIRSLTESFDSKLVGTGNPLVRQLGRYLAEGWPKPPEAQAKGRWQPAGWSRSPVKRPPSRPNESRPTIFS
jgi:hypothetical protein